MLSNVNLNCPQMIKVCLEYPNSLLPTVQIAPRTSSAANEMRDSLTEAVALKRLPFAPTTTSMLPRARLVEGGT